ncbi:MAG: hypothetical protein ACLP22_19220, partial [Solirubrobacteraceae bacterium]
PTTSANQVTYTFHLMTSGVGELQAGYGQVVLAFPAGTGLPACERVTFMNPASGASALASSCTKQATTLTATVPFLVAANAVLVETVSSVANPAVRGAELVTVSTSTDGPVNAPFTLTPGPAVTPVSGHARVRFAGSTVFRALIAANRIPFGSTIDTRNGLVRVQPPIATSHLEVQYTGGEVVITHYGATQILGRLLDTSGGGCPAPSAAGDTRIASAAAVEHKRPNGRRAARSRPALTTTRPTQRPCTPVTDRPTWKGRSG